MRRLHDWINPVPQPLGGDGRWHSGHHLSGREPSSPRYVPGVNGRCHIGLDTAGIEGSAVVSPDDGMVTGWDYNTGAGNFVTVRHVVRHRRSTLVLWTSQLHCLADQQVEVGQPVKQGDTIALLGDTGSSASPHVHTRIMLTPVAADWHRLDLFIDPEPVYYPGRWAFMQTGHPYPNEVRKLQRRLNALNYTPPLVTDGSYGPATVNAVKWWQHRTGIEETGAASELTLALLFAARAGKEA